MRTTKRSRIVSLGAVIAFAAALLLIGRIAQAAPYVSGTFSTPYQHGALQFTPLKRVVGVGVEGRFLIHGKSYPGTLYGIRHTNNVAMVWYYGTSGLSAGSAVATYVAGTTYVGTIQFTDKAGTVTDAGTLTVSIVDK